ncbi:MAG: hypothetical protein JRH15_17445 [Deltaproteobacteria bacterium]|nr:hypothetical protein [Deltaproteobacteria bacterium]
MRRLLLLFFMLPVLILSCAFHELAIAPIELSDATPITVKSPVKAHLMDGSTIVFAEGVTVKDGRVFGAGRKYDILLVASVQIAEVALADVAAMESFQTPVDAVTTGVVTVGVSAGAVVGGTLLFKAIFGSCPTTYSIDAGVPVLEAESFSYSIAPSFEARDVDRLGINPGVGNSIALEMHNEALETHYINHVELLEVIHSREESVYLDHKGRPVVVNALLAPDAVRDRSGRRLDRIVGSADDVAWRTDGEYLKDVSGDMEDYVDLEFTVPATTDEVALFLRLRNSLLNTILLYEVMLKGQGFRALDWMANDLNRLVTKYRLGYWYNKRMGMRILVRDKYGRYRKVARLPDTGPIAWNELVVRLPAVKGEKLHVRLAFIADNWRIDHLALATTVGRAKTRPIPLSRVANSENAEISKAPGNLRAADDAYVITKPGDMMHLQFDVGSVPQDRKRTFFLATEGYYIEWMRRDWLEKTSTSAFVPNDTALLRALALWAPRRNAYREQFELMRILIR